MSKPVELIIANTVHDAAEQMARNKLLFDTVQADPGAVHEAIARKLLCSLSHDAALSMVLRALGAVGGPATLSDIGARLVAARDAQSAESNEPVAVHGGVSP